MASLLECYERIYEIVRTIPHGRVMTYGQIAGMVAVDCPGPAPAITVGRAMAASSRYAPDLPWWRVIGRAGDYGVLRSLPLSATQQRLLAGEGIVADAEGRYDLGQYLFTP
jgi:methylated-DNA-protein-cysteine methyltransferase-like protein